MVGSLDQNKFVRLTDDELHETMMRASPGSVNFEWAKTELKNRDRKRSKQRNRQWIGIFAVVLAAGGIVAGAWPYLVWWVQHGFRFR
jgi:hypothetical protein